MLLCILFDRWSSSIYHYDGWWSLAYQHILIGNVREYLSQVTPLGDRYRYWCTDHFSWQSIWLLNMFKYKICSNVDKLIDKIWQIWAHVRFDIWSDCYQIQAYYNLNNIVRHTYSPIFVLTRNSNLNKICHFKHILSNLGKKHTCVSIKIVCASSNYALHLYKK